MYPTLNTALRILVIHHNIHLLFLHGPLELQCVSYDYFLSGFKSSTFSRSDVSQFVIQVSGCTCNNKIQQSPPAWTQEAYRPRRTSFRGGGGIPILTGEGTPILSGGGGGVTPRCHPGVPLSPEGIWDQRLGYSSRKNRGPETGVLPPEWIRIRDWGTSPLWTDKVKTLPSPSFGYGR